MSLLEDRINYETGEDLSALKQRFSAMKADNRAARLRGEITEEDRIAQDRADYRSVQRAIAEYDHSNGHCRNHQRYIDEMRVGAIVRYTALRDRWFAGESSRLEYHVSVSAMYLRLFSVWVRWGCLSRSFTAEEFNEYLAESEGNDIAHRRGDFDLSQLCAMNCAHESATLHAQFVLFGQYGEHARKNLNQSLSNFAEGDL